ERLQRHIECSCSGKKRDFPDCRLRIADYANAAARVQFLLDGRCERTERGRGNRNASRIVPGGESRPAERICQSVRERIRLAGAPMIAESPDHKTFGLDQLVLGREDAVVRFAWWRRRVGSRVERRLTSNDEIRARFYGE